MRTGRSSIIGVLAGVCLSQVLLFGHDLAARQFPIPLSGPILSESSGKIDQVVVHYVSGSKTVSGEIFHSFFGQLDPGVRVSLVVPDERAAAEFFMVVGEDVAARHEFNVVEVRHPITTWSRDRWIAREPVLKGAIPAALGLPWALPLVIQPYAENLGETWTERAGDGKVAAALETRAHVARAFRSDLLFDGGDFVADEQQVFVTPDVARRNAAESTTAIRQLSARLQQLTGKPVALLAKAPEHHAGMFMMLIGGGRAIVADPRAGLLIAKTNPAMAAAIPEGISEDEAIFALYDAVAEALMAHGYRVTRVPSIHTNKYKAYISYTNAIIDETPTGKVVFLPVYDSLDDLNAAAARVWEDAGFAVRPVPVSGAYALGGTLHCLVNVLSRRQL